MRVTRYGADAGDVGRAAAVLRARAAAGGLTLADADTADLAASVIAADAWLWLCKTDSFDHPAAYGPAAVAALAAILARAGGHRRYLTGEAFGVMEVDLEPESIDAAESYRSWADTVCGQPEATLRRAAADLAAGAEDALTRQEMRLAAFASLLDVTGNS